MRRDDEGQITLPLVVFVVVMFAVCLGLFGFGEASDSRGKAQKAADAAALGAAVAGRDAMVTSILLPSGGAVFHGRWPSVAGVSGAYGVGCARAQSWAARNSSSTTVACRYDVPDEFTVST